ncbi:MAG: FHA domain-containing serine/threonine-protein kinase [Verrucomicrobiae bacterium]|nr:FHA domain-containing serine/threonine-protein kinase [Verrucomicrobiae bacterium]
MDTNRTFLGKYELLAVIGDGAEGRVYKARHTTADHGGDQGELVAVKRLKNTGHDKESQQFIRQNKILSKLNHPNIVSYKDSFVWQEKEIEDDIYCLVMELLDGEPLKAVLERNSNGLAWELVRNVLTHTLSALQYACKKGVIHRDLKPSNIYITRGGVPKLVDFGIARQDDGEATATSSAAGAKGTFDYMAPDFALQPGGFRGDEQSDIFSFGVILYHTLTGSLPFPPLGENAARGYYIRWLGNQPTSAEFRHPIFRVLSHASSCVRKCIHPDRAERFKTFDEVVASFNQIGHRKLKHNSEVYELTGWLGRGGFGEVYRARRVRDQREVAVKRLFSVNYSSRFVREAKILRDSPHPNLTQYVDFIDAQMSGGEREYYLILEYLEGMPGAGLRARIKKSGDGLDPVEALQLFVGYLDCLEHLHRNGIIHRDIKPANLYAPERNPQKAKIFDLGIAHDEEGTRTHGQVPGTLDYMPPEFAAQSSGRGSAQSDIYSIGVTLYQALTGRLPFPRLPEKEDEAWVAFFRRAEKPLDCPVDHPVFRSHPELVSLVRRAVGHDHKRRFPSAGAMRDEIKQILKKWSSSPVVDDEERPTATTMAHPRNFAVPEPQPDPVPDPEIKKSAEQRPPAPAPAPPVVSPPVAVRPQRLELHDQDGTRIYLTTQSAVRIGRNRDCEIFTRAMNSSGQEQREQSLMISQYHALIEWRKEACVLKDGGLHPERGWQPSTAGLWVDGQRVTGGGIVDLLPNRGYRIALGDPGRPAANPIEFNARLWAVKDLPAFQPSGQAAEAPACLVLRRLAGPRWIYILLRSGAALAWADSRCGRACAGLHQGSLHLGEGSDRTPLLPGSTVTAGALNFKVTDLLGNG